MNFKSSCLMTRITNKMIIYAKSDSTSLLNKLPKTKILNKQKNKKIKITKQLSK